ncbi:MAG TPA: hypothetical protein VKL19_14835, partial [Thermoanaerobaculia bacterium]|nr:hypothetical protein [Thermoanaerobaculia bacterium]
MAFGGWRLAVGLFACASVADAEILHFTGFLTGRGIYVRSQPSWLDGGFGRFETGAKSATDGATTHQEEAQLGVDWTPNTWLHVHGHGIARKKKSGLVEAYVDLQKDFGANNLRLRAGQFFLPTSRENTDRLWSSPYTISFSALNTWIGEEMRPIGTELQWQRLTSNAVVTVAGGAFRGNDTMGALLGWRGWSIGNRLSVYNEVLPLPPLFSLKDPNGFDDQRSDGTKPFGPDLDRRTGVSARIRVSLPERATLQLARVDNRGDRFEYREEYAWQTRLNLLSGEIDGPHGTTFASEYGWGSTGMGFAQQAFVDLSYYAAYALLSQTFGRNRLSARFEVFGTQDKDHSFAENNTESGHAWTLAWFYNLRPSIRLGAEFANVAAQRAAAAQSGFDANTDGRT